MDMDIKNMAVTALLPYEKNTKAHPEDQVARIAASIKEFGFNQPVLVDGSGVLVAGHGRVLAAQSLGLEAVPTICVDHLTPEQVRAYRIADNKTAESDWLDEVLRQELDDLRAWLLRSGVFGRWASRSCLLIFQNVADGYIFQQKPPRFSQSRGLSVCFYWTK
jgi:hypothetical protein